MNSQVTRALLLATRFGTASRILGALRSGTEPDALEILNSLDDEDRAGLQAQAKELDEGGVDAIVFGDVSYPAQLLALKSPPPVLWVIGNRDLLHRPSVGMCGSRHVSEAGLKAAAACGREVADRDLVIVSGYAKGVDTETHLAALTNGGSTVVVLAEGIAHFRQKRAFAKTGLPLDRVLVVSQFPPTQRWTVGAAMTRNGVIAGLSKALVVIEAGETGGTLNAGLQGIALGRPVLALDFASSETPAGNLLLFEHGARPIHTRQHLGRTLDEIDPPGTVGTAQLSLI